MALLACASHPNHGSHVPSAHFRHPCRDPGGLDRSSRASSTRKQDLGAWISGLPALNFDADEGFGYGLILALYGYDPASVTYRWTVQPTVFLTTQGRRDYTLFFDAPSSREHPWRVTAYAGREQQLAAPYYGLGNATPYDSALEHGSTRYFYRYGRDRTRLTTDVQHALWHPSVRALVGAGVSVDKIDLTPFDSGTTLLQHDLSNSTPKQGHTNFLRAGLTWDTRDREIGTLSGTWADVLVQRVDKKLGASTSYTRWTATAETLPAIWWTLYARQPPARPERESRRAVLRTRRNPDDAETARRAGWIEQRARTSEGPIRRAGNRCLQQRAALAGGRVQSARAAIVARAERFRRRGSRVGERH